MIPDEVGGIALARAYFDEVVEPLLRARFPALAYAAGRLGAGSDVLGLDDAVSRDHDWGLRLSVFVPEDRVGDVRDAVERMLPATFRGLPTRFPFTGQTDAVHHVEVESVAGFVTGRVGFDPRAGMTARDWLSLSGQAVLEVTAGPVFADRAGELTAVRRALEWYPDDLWRHVLACDWGRLAQELPLMGRAADVGDEVGSRIIAARLVQVVMHLAFLLERRWAPYAKWFGTVFRSLECAPRLEASLATALNAANAERRQRALGDALAELLQVQNGLGLTDAAEAAVPFWDRPYLHPNPVIVEQLLTGITDAEVRALPRGRGSIEQRTDNVDVLVSAAARRAAVAD
ncbi:DUF4037 domain-containing protein [Gryllotalpicola daejeonensis]|uniref:DUF4037 domain-containing protein n=1 Tax=Gryllotalpicola daejeonensis TaxID=993087 RepID=A0ABP7ZKD6_9MICO